MSDSVWLLAHTPDANAVFAMVEWEMSTPHWFGLNKQSRYNDGRKAWNLPHTDVPDVWAELFTLELFLSERPLCWAPLTVESCQLPCFLCTDPPRRQPAGCRPAAMTSCRTYMFVTCLHWEGTLLGLWEIEITEEWLLTSQPMWLFGVPKLSPSGVQQWKSVHW